MHDRVGLGVAHDARQHFRPPARRAKHDAARHPVEIDQRGGGEGHVAHEQHDRAAAQPLQAVARLECVAKSSSERRMVARRDDAPVETSRRSIRCARCIGP